VFIKETLNSSINLLVLFNGISAKVIDCANFAKAYSPAGPIAFNLLCNSLKFVPLDFKESLNFVKSKAPVFGFKALYKLTYN